MTDEKSVLVIGLDPTLIDLSHPDYASTGMDAIKVLAGLKSSEDELTRLGYSVQMCLTDFGETAEAVVQSQLKQKRFDCILIAAGIRTIPSNSMLGCIGKKGATYATCFRDLMNDWGVPGFWASADRGVAA